MYNITLSSDRLSVMKIYLIFYFFFSILNIVATQNDLNYEEIMKSKNQQTSYGGMLRSLRSETPKFKMEDIGRKRVLRSLSLGNPVSLITILEDKIPRPVGPVTKTRRIDPWMEGIIMSTK